MNFSNLLSKAFLCSVYGVEVRLILSSWKVQKIRTFLNGAFPDRASLKTLRIQGVPRTKMKMQTKHGLLLMTMRRTRIPETNVVLLGYSVA